MTAATPFSPDPSTEDALFPAHLDSQLDRYARALAAEGFDAVVIDAGEASTHFLDDIAASFRPNPHFRLFTPCAPAEGSALLLEPGARPVLLHLRPRDFWHLPPAPPEGAWVEHFEIRPVADAAARERAIDEWCSARGRVARIGSTADTGERNPAGLLTRLHFERARKTPYEVACMRAANLRAARGHVAAARAFTAGGSEFEIHLAYLAATAHEDAELPYPNIVALDAHGAVLHYQHRLREAPSGGARSFLIDAGADWRGYAADVTRTHTRAGGAFADLVGALDTLQQDLVGRIRPGLDWVDLHEQAHAGLASVLIDAGIARGDADNLVATGVTRAFLPHGLGHLIGLQTHDVGGTLTDPKGGERPPPDDHPALRLTRALEPDFVVTVEPGLYFVPMLLDELRDGAGGHRVDWDVVAALLPFGGIRIEDDVRVTEEGCENLTRPAFRSVLEEATA